MTELAKHVVVRRTGDEYEFSVDGQPFPWHIASSGLHVTVADDEIPAVTFTLLAEHVDVDHNLRKTKGEQ